MPKRMPSTLAYLRNLLLEDFGLRRLWSFARTLVHCLDVQDTLFGAWGSNGHLFVSHCSPLFFSRKFKFFTGFHLVVFTSPDHWLMLRKKLSSELIKSYFSLLRSVSKPSFPLPTLLPHYYFLHCSLGFCGNELTVCVYLDLGLWCQPPSVEETVASIASKIILCIGADSGFTHRLLWGYYYMIPKKSRVLSLPLLPGLLCRKKLLFTSSKLTIRVELAAGQPLHGS